MRLEIREYHPGRRGSREALRPCDVAAQREGTRADGDHSELEDGLSMEFVEPEQDTERMGRSRRKVAQEFDVVLEAQWNQVDLIKEAKWTQQPAATTDACSSRADERVISTCMKISR
mmetsp:Transcript_76419/g.247929  ORF Transcript_76419/g.247929 Transcript_76419/m.247929 type:complete len:117 (+) Transcript_76419:732-1082(+)